MTVTDTTTHFPDRHEPVISKYNTEKEKRRPEITLDKYNLPSTDHGISTLDMKLQSRSFDVKTETGEESQTINDEIYEPSVITLNKIAQDKLGNVEGSGSAQTFKELSKEIHLELTNLITKVENNYERMEFIGLEDFKAPELFLLSIFNKKISDNDKERLITAFAYTLIKQDFYINLHKNFYNTDLSTIKEKVTPKYINHFTHLCNTDKHYFFDIVKLLERCLPDYATSEDTYWILTVVQSELKNKELSRKQTVKTFFYHYTEMMIETIKSKLSMQLSNLDVNEIIEKYNLHDLYSQTEHDSLTNLNRVEHIPVGTTGEITVDKLGDVEHSDSAETFEELSKEISDFFKELSKNELDYRLIDIIEQEDFEAPQVFLLSIFDKYISDNDKMNLIERLANKLVILDSTKSFCKSPWVIRSFDDDPTDNTFCSQNIKALAYFIYDLINYSDEDDEKIDVIVNCLPDYATNEITKKTLSEIQSALKNQSGELTVNQTMKYFFGRYTQSMIATIKSKLNKRLSNIDMHDIIEKYDLNILYPQSP